MNNVTALKTTTRNSLEKSLALSILADALNALFGVTPDTVDICNVETTKLSFVTQESTQIRLADNRKLTVTFTGKTS